jgi:hypothetical protein
LQLVHLQTFLCRCLRCFSAEIQSFLNDPLRLIRVKEYDRNNLVCWYHNLKILFSNSIQIINVYECNGIRIFSSWGERWNVLFNEVIAKLLVKLLSNVTSVTSLKDKNST